MTMRRWLPPSVRWWIKLAVIEHAMTLGAVHADDESVLARERIWAGWHVRWLVRYALRLRALKGPTNAL